MAPQEHAALARIDSLDSETACRVARLVIECCASPSLALLAVLNANANQQPAEWPQQLQRYGGLTKRGS